MGNSDSSQRATNASYGGASSSAVPPGQYGNTSAQSSSAASVSSSSAAPSGGSSSAAAAAEAAMGAQGSSAPPGAYKMPGQARTQRFYVTIPRGVRPGQHFAVLVNGQQMMVRCPESNRPGDRLVVTAPRSTSQQYVVTVPPNVRAGQQFRVMINNQEVMVTCPRGVRPGQRVTFQLPQTPPSQSSQQERDRERGGAGNGPQAAPNHQMFEVSVPDGVRAGQPFALIANGQRVMVTCPPNVRPGQKIRFQLPIQLSQQQIEAIRVNYDKDGWMRCLGPDLKFHWVYNKSSSSGANSSNNSNNNTNNTNNSSGSKSASNKENGSESSLSPHTVSATTGLPHKVFFDADEHAVVRDFALDEHNERIGIRYIPATEYALETTVKGTNINYSELSHVATLPFTQKVEWLKAQFANLRVPWEEGHIKLKVRRGSVLQDSMDAIESIDKDDMRKIFRFEFLGEPALDAGGVAREFFSIISEQLFNPDFGLFLYSAVNQMCMQINPNSGIANEFHLRYFHMCGRVLGKALMDGHTTPVHLVRPIYKHLMGWPVTIHDCEYLDDQVYNNLLDLLDMDDVAALFLEFVVTEERLGVTENVELIPDGENVTVDAENLAQYLEEQCKYRTLTRVQDQLFELVKGFYDVVPEPLLSIFDFQELELVLHGLPNIDMDDWMHTTELTGDFQNQPNNKVVQWFWEVVRSYEHEQQAKLLQFVTGTSGVPIQGFAYLQGNDGSIRRFTIHGDKNIKVFPRAHTCFNRIDLPMYKTKAELQKYLTMAISMESTGFGIE